MRQLRRLEELKGYSLLARDGEMGEVEEMYFDAEKPVSRHYEAEIHRHFGWPPYWVGTPSGGAVPVPPLPPAGDLRAAPEHPHLRAPYDPAKVIGREYEAALYAHYGRSAQEDGDA